MERDTYRWVVGGAAVLMNYVGACSSERVMNFRLCNRKPNIVTTRKVRKLECAGLLVRMCDGRTVKEVFLGKPDGRRNAGRPKLRWLNCIECLTVGL
jgi:hypothetical protein